MVKHNTHLPNQIVMLLTQVVIVKMKQTNKDVIMMEVTAVDQMLIPTTVQNVSAMKTLIVPLHLIWLEMASAMMKPTMRDAFLTLETVVDYVLIQIIAQIVFVMAIQQDLIFGVSKPMIKCLNQVNRVNRK